MSPEAQRIACAESQGLDTKLCPIHLSRSCCGKKPLPDYDDLNVIRELEVGLSGDEFRIYLGFLGGRRTIPKLMSMDEFQECWNSNATQRREAYLKTKGLWQEQPQPKE